MYYVKQRSKVVHHTSYIANYFDRIATTGSNRAAIDAGIIPAKTPMVMQREIASVKMPGEIKTGKLNK